MIRQESEAFTLVTASSQHQNYDDYVHANSGKAYNLNVYLQAALRRQYPELALTVTQASNVNLLAFAFAGHATATLDTIDESVLRTRYFYQPSTLSESRTFAKYLYKWGEEFFIVYIVQIGYYPIQYILKEPSEGETTMSANGKTDELVRTIGKWAIPPPAGDKWVYVYDRYWIRSKALYEQIKNASWDDVILNEGMKKQITSLMHKFFDSKDIYKNFGVPWKRGVIFHGPAGNGKTISIKALMNSLFKSDGLSIPSLYVKSASSTYDIRSIFQQARWMSPCLLIFEDIDTVVTDSTRSYFFNEVDGLENNDGIFMVASTNHLDKLDAGLSSRPSRFDRKYLFPAPSEDERVLYCEFWRKKLATKKVDIEFPKKLCPAIALITDEFSFAYIQEAFVATLLAIALKRSDPENEPEINWDYEGGGGLECLGDPEQPNNGDGDLNDYELWTEMKKTVKQLRDDMGGKSTKSMTANAQFEVEFTAEKEAQKPVSAMARARAQRSAGKKSEVIPEAPQVLGRTLEVDEQGVPIFNEEGTFVYESAEAKEGGEQS